MSEIDVREMHLIDLDDDIQYILKMFLEEDKIHFWLKEDKIYAPFTFEESLTYDQFVQLNKIFKACDDLKDIIGHLNKLYDQKRIILMTLGGRGQKMLMFDVDFISQKGLRTEHFTLELKMTENKDDDLLKLYKIQKDQIAALRKVFKLIKDAEMSKELPFYKAIMNEIAKCESKVDYE